LIWMKYFFRKERIPGIFILSIHDEIWFMVSEGNMVRAAKCLQLAHLFTYCLLYEALGFTSIPLDYAFFSEVNVDRCIRKEVDMRTKTPSNPTEEIPDGLSLTVDQIFGFLKDKEAP